MSTRGFVGIRKDGKDKGGYNHSDSYYSGLGSEIVSFLRGKTLKKLKDIFDNIVFVDYEKEDFVAAWDWDNSCFNLRFTDNSEFLRDSLFCEYACIVNLDDRVLEIYRGFNKNPEGNGRYASQYIKSEAPRVEQYYGVVLQRTIPLRELFAGKWHVKDTDCGMGAFYKEK